MRPARTVAVLAASALLAAGTSASASGAAPPVGARTRAVAPDPAPSGQPYVSAITAVSAADLAASWRPGCPVPPEDLRAVTVTHTDFTGASRLGRIVVHADVAQAVADVFADLYAQRFPIASVRPVEAFGGSDDASMAADNTSGFNCRATTGGTGFSEHSYGTAIDVNPVENPYVRGTTVLPEAGRSHLDRSPAPGRITAGDAVVEAFAARGFSWGGDWNSLKDYQHFSVSGD
ncbi:M15 family metallopeptidase [Kineococcus arenarius]|uniref:M15 family metallopeptidase n=1 Tax=unclassified Kineococcus TaxID=2621656 RepID=UPI003D7E852B